MSKTEKKKGGKFVNALLLILEIVCIGVFVFSGYSLLNTLVIEPYKAKKESSSMHSSINIGSADKNGKWKYDFDVIQDEVNDNGILISMQAALAACDDVKGWIAVPGTVINYPVVQSPYKNDNQFYLRRGLDKKKLHRGTLFLDNTVEITDDITQNKNYVIYGHNMRNGTMFHDLLQYSDPEFYKKNPVLEFDTIYQSGQWVVFSVMKCNVNSGLDKVFEYYDTHFNSDDEFESFIDEICSRSIIKTGIDVNKDDTLLTLQTCSYEYKYIRRKIIYV